MTKKRPKPEPEDLLMIATRELVAGGADNPAIFCTKDEDGDSHVFAAESCGLSLFSPGSNGELAWVPSACLAALRRALDEAERMSAVHERRCPQGPVSK